MKSPFIAITILPFLPFAAPQSNIDDAASAFLCITTYCQASIIIDLPSCNTQHFHGWINCVCWHPDMQQTIQRCVRLCAPELRNWVSFCPPIPGLADPWLRTGAAAEKAVGSSVVGMMASASASASASADSAMTMTAEAAAATTAAVGSVGSSSGLAGGAETETSGADGARVGGVFLLEVMAAGIVVRYL